MTTIYNNNRYYSTSKSDCEYACNDKCHTESVRTIIHPRRGSSYHVYEYLNTCNNVNQKRLNKLYIIYAMVILSVIIYIIVVSLSIMYYKKVNTPIKK